MDLTWDHFSETICAVDVAALIAWLPTPGGWIIQQGDSPARLMNVPMAQAVIAEIAKHFPCPIRAQEIVLSRMMPGQNHGMHIDRQTSDWLTRVHVPLVTNAESWLRFEDQPDMHFDVGWAYTFNTERRHAFANLGDTPRVHLIFDAMRR